MRTSTAALYTLATLLVLDATHEDGSQSNLLPPSLPALGDWLLKGDAAQALGSETAKQAVNQAVNQTIVPPARTEQPDWSMADIQGHWAEPFIQALHQDGIVQGFGDGQFRPDAPISAEHLKGMVVRAIAQQGPEFLYRYAQQTLQGEAKPVFQQALVPSEGLGHALLTAAVGPGAAGPAAEALSQWTASSGLKGVLSPVRLESEVAVIGAPTRAEAIAFLYQAMQQVKTPPAALAATAQDLTKSGQALPPVVAAKQGQKDAQPAVAAESQPAKADQSVAQLAASFARLTAASPPPHRTEPAKVATFPASSPQDNSPMGSQPDPNLSNVPIPGSKTDTNSSATPAVPAIDPAPAGSSAPEPEAQAPKVQVPQIQAPKVQVPQIQAPQIQAPQIQAPTTQSTTQSPTAPKIQAPTIQSPLEGITTACKPEAIDPTAAIAACDRALAGNPNPEQATASWYARGMALKQVGRTQEAANSLTEALKLQPNNSAVLTEQCRTLSELGQQDQARASCDQALQADQQWGEKSPGIAWLNQAMVLTRQGRGDEALQAYDQALRLNDQDAAAWTRKGQLLSRMGRQMDALMAQERALNVTPNYALAIAHRAAALNKLARYEEALTDANQALAADGKWGEVGDSVAWDQKATALAGLGRHGEALQAADKAVQQKPNYAEAWNNRGVILWNLQRDEEALASVERSLGIRPNYVQGWFNKGRILRTLERYEEATAAYDQALQGDIGRVDKPTLAAIWTNRSAALWRAGQFQAALNSADQAIALDNGGFLGWFNRAGVLMSLDQHQDAAKSYNQALVINPGYGSAWVGKGLALERVGNYAEALTALDQALAINPDQMLAKLSRDAILRKIQASRPNTSSSQG
jgi:tetratricopeptide (TPR) repeat protein